MNINQNLVLQIEEQEVLKSIFWHQWQKTQNVANTYSFKLGNEVEMWITFNDFYPLVKPPSYELWAPKLTKNEKDLVDREFSFIYESNKGYPIIFQWIEKLKEIVEQHEGLQMDKSNKSCKEKINSINDQPKGKRKSLEKKRKNEVELEIIHGPTITDRRSTFQGHVFRVTDISQIKKFQGKLLENKKVAQAKHNVIAYRIVVNKKVLLQDCDDDGEAHAGGKLLHLLNILGVCNVAVIVTRWYGGIHLGPDRFKHYNNAARQALVGAGLVS